MSWVDSLLDKATEFIGDDDDPDTGLARTLIGTLENHSDALKLIAEDQAMKILAAIGTGDMLKAQELYINEFADADGLIHGMETGTALMVEAFEIQEAKKQKLIEIATDLGFAAARFGLTLLLA